MKLFGLNDKQRETSMLRVFTRSVIAAMVLAIETSAPSFAQTSAFQFLNLPGHAVLSAQGGVNVSQADRNVTYFQSNPALAGDTLNGYGAASYMFYLGNTGLANFSYQQNFKRIGALAMGVQHLSLGQIQGYDVLGNPTAKFSSGETAVMIGKSHQIRYFRLGVNVKGVFSNIAGYRAQALVFDVGGTFIHPRHDFTVGLVIKNFGFMMSDFSETSSTQLPFDVQAGTTFKPEHMPVRFSITAYHLIRYNIPYYNANATQEQPNSFDKAMSHFNFGAEVLVHKYGSVLLGYNILRHQELKLNNAGGASGLSFGFLLKTKALNLAASRSGYVTSGAYQVTLSVQLQKLITRKFFHA